MSAELGLVLVNIIDDTLVNIHLANREIATEELDQSTRVAKRNLLCGQIIRGPADRSSVRSMQERVEFTEYESPQFQVRTVSPDKALAQKAIPVELQTPDGRISIVYLCKESLKKRFPKIPVTEFASIMCDSQQQAERDRLDATNVAFYRERR